MSNEVNNFYEFGEFRLDGKTGMLWRDGDVVSLSPKASELLKLLVARTGDVVSKQEIFDSVWADTFVEDGVLTQNIYTLRNTLGSELIETVPRRGYRFAGHVTVVPADESVAVAERIHTSGAFDGYDYEDLSAELLEDDSSDVVSGEIVRPTMLQPRVTSSPRSSSRLALVLTMIAIALVGSAGFGYYYFTRSNPVGAQASKIAPIEQIRFASLTDTGDVTHPTMSPDGKTFAFTRLEGEQASVWIKQIATGQSLQILPPSSKGYRSLAFSSDGKYLYFRDETDPGDVYQASPFGGTPKKVADNVWSDFSVSPDGRQLAFVRRDPQRNALLLMLSEIDGGGERELGTRNPPAGYRGGAPAWSPDGTKLAVTVGSTEEARPVPLTVDVNSGTEAEVKTPQFRDISKILWTLDAKQLILAGRLASEATSQLWMLALDDGELRRLTNDLETYFWPSLSADGKTLIARQQKIIANLWLLPDGDLKKARQLTTGQRNLDGFVGLTWTPQGKIVFSSRLGHITDLYSIGPDGGERVQLTSNAGSDNTWPNASHDGRYIFFTSNRSGTRAIWRIDADGRNTKQITSGEVPKVSGFSSAPSVDGSRVFFLKSGPNPSAIWRTSMDGGEAEPVSRLVGATAEGFLSESADGKWLAYQHVSDAQGGQSEDGAIQIGVIASDGSGDPRLFDVRVRRPIFHWTSDDTFDYIAGTFNTSAIWRQPLNGESRKLIDFPDRIFNFAWSSDGKDLVVSRGKLVGDAVMVSNLP